jgi:hypothetical protein
LRRVLAKQRSDVDAYQEHEKDGSAKEYRNHLADGAEEAAFKMSGVAEV